jgi:hypothetical protein
MATFENPIIFHVTLPSAEKIDPTLISCETRVSMDETCKENFMEFVQEMFKMQGKNGLTPENIPYYARMAVISATTMNDINPGMFHKKPRTPRPQNDQPDYNSGQQSEYNLGQIPDVDLDEDDIE